MEKIYRSIIIISLILYLVFWFLPYFDYNWLSVDELRFLEANGFNSKIPESEILDWGLLILWIMVSFGLYFYISISRNIFVLLYIFSTVATFFWGYVVFTPYEMGLHTLITLCDGAIFIMIFFTSISSRFTNDS